jgi:hypothetical protein
LKGLFDEAKRNPERSLYRGFLRALAAVEWAEIHQQPILAELHRVKKRVLGRYTGRDTFRDRELDAGHSVDYRDYFWFRYSTLPGFETRESPLLQSLLDADSDEYDRRPGESGDDRTARQTDRYCVAWEPAIKHFKEQS